MLLRELAYKKRAWQRPVDFRQTSVVGGRGPPESCLTVRVLLLLFFWPGGIFAISHTVRNQRESKLISTKVMTLGWFTAYARPIISARRCIILLCKQTTTLWVEMLFVAQLQIRPSWVLLDLTITLCCIQSQGLE